MEKVKFATVYCTFENLAVVRETLPSVIEESKRTGSALVVHDSSMRDVDEKWDYLRALAAEHDFFLILTSPLSMAQARNLCLDVCIDKYLPEYICMMEDDHGYHPGFIDRMVAAMDEHYGTVAPNGLRFGLFSGCRKHFFHPLEDIGDGNQYPNRETSPARLGGVNSCMRCAPTHHWQRVLKGYDVDDYPISGFQTGPLNLRNYHRGFTVMIVAGGTLVYDIDAVGRGVTAESGTRLWDETYAASDPRAKYDKPLWRHPAPLKSPPAREASPAATTPAPESAALGATRAVRQRLHHADGLAEARFTEDDLRQACMEARSKFAGSAIYVVTDLPTIGAMDRFFMGTGAQVVETPDHIPRSDQLGVVVPCLGDDRRLMDVLIAIHQRDDLVYFPPQLTHPPARFFQLDTLAANVLRQEAAIDLPRFDLLDFENIIQAIEATRPLSGHYVEIGVAEGRSAHLALNYMKAAGIERPAWFLDTYQGFQYEEAERSPDRFWNQVWQPRCGYDAVAALMSPYANATVLRCNILHDELPEAIDSIAVANIDVDLHEATTAALEKVIPRLARGGIVILEDFGHTPLCGGAQLAARQFLGRPDAADIQMIYMASGQLFLLKQ